MSEDQKIEKHLLEVIASETNASDKALEDFYKSTKKMFTAFILQNNGNVHDVEDLFQEGIQYLILNTRNGEFQQKSSLKTYLFRICRNLWLTKLRRENKWRDIQQVLQLNSLTQTDEMPYIEKVERKQILEQALAFVSDACKQVLSLWAQGYSMKEIARATDYKNEKSVKKKKSICLKALVGKVKQHPELVKALLNYL